MCVFRVPLWCQLWLTLIAVPHSPSRITSSRHSRTTQRGVSDSERRFWDGNRHTNTRNRQAFDARPPCVTDERF